LYIKTNKMSDVEKIKERLGIVDVIGSYIPIEKAGMNYRARCPFHNEKTPSFNISPDRNLYYCFGCGARGDIFTFVEEFEGVDFIGALKFLADKAGIELSGEVGSAKKDHSALYKVMEEAVDFYQKRLASNNFAKEYLTKRGIKEDTIESFSIGYAPDDWRELYSHLISIGYTDMIIEKAGLIKKSDNSNDKNKSYYDRFRNRIMFPISDSTGRVVAFSGRSLEKKTENLDAIQVAKYLNSPETELFNKSDVLYGYDKAKQHIKKADRAILVEGQIDLIMAHQEGFPYSVAVSGTSFTGSHLSRIKRLTDNLIIIFDRDKAGILSMKKTAIMALGKGMNVNAVLLPEGKDPADILLSDKDLWYSELKKTEHVINVFVEEIAKKKQEQRDFWKSIKKHVLPFVKEIQDSIDQAHFIDYIHKMSDIPKNSIIEELSKMDIQEENDEIKITSKNVDTKSNLSRKETVLRRLSAIILWQKSSANPAIDIEKTLAELARLNGPTLEEMASMDIQDLIFRIETLYSDKGVLKDDVEELVLFLEEAILSEDLSRSTKKLKDAEKEKDKDLQKKLMAEYQSISNKLEEVKKIIKSRIN